MKISDRPYNGIYNTDESKVPPCEIPSPLKTADGGTIRNAFEWIHHILKISSVSLQLPGITGLAGIHAIG